MHIEESARFVKADGCELSQAPDGYIIYQSAKERVHYLNPTAAVIYELCESSRPLCEIGDHLQSIFDLPEVPHAEVADCIEKLLVADLIVRC